MLIIMLVAILFNALHTNCQEQEQFHVKFHKNVYSILLEIPDEYNIVKQNNLGTDHNENVGKNILSLQKNSKFAQKQAPDFYALKSSDVQHQANKYNYIKGKNIFTPEYIQTYTKGEEIHSQKPEAIITNKNQVNKEPYHVIEKSPQNKQIPATPKSITETKMNEEIINQRSSQLYNEFKNIEILKQKNLRQAIKDSLQSEKSQNFLKLIGYVLGGLILSFAIIKKATKSEPKLASKNQERSQLRLQDTVQDDESVSSSDSDQI